MPGRGNYVRPEADGSKLYQGRPCPQGHSGLRWRSNYACVECLRQHVTKYHGRHRSLRLEYFSELAKRDPAGNRRRSRKWYALNRDQAQAKNGEWKRQNPEAVRSHLRNSNARRRSTKLAGSVSAAEWRDVLARHSGRCAQCGSVERIEMDHIVPLSRGGAHSHDNVQPLCAPCNRRKWAHV